MCACVNVCVCGCMCVRSRYGGWGNTRGPFVLDVTSCRKGYAQNNICSHIQPNTLTTLTVHRTRRSNRCERAWVASVEPVVPGGGRKQREVDARGTSALVRHSVRINETDEDEQPGEGPKQAQLLRHPTHAPAGVGCVQLTAGANDQHLPDLPVIRTHLRTPQNAPWRRPVPAPRP